LCCTEEIIDQGDGFIDRLNDGLEALADVIVKTKAITSIEKKADAYKDKVVPAMAEVRAAADELETLVDADMWPLPTYAQMLFVR
jgi:glutamine synthetase